MSPRGWGGRVSLLVFACALMVGACEDDDIPLSKDPNYGTPGLSIISGNKQSVLPSDTLAERMVVEYRDESGHPVDNAYIVFDMTGGPAMVFKLAEGNSPQELRVPTDVAGRASAQVRAYAGPSSPGIDTIQVKATVEEDIAETVTFVQFRVD